MQNYLNYLSSMYDEKTFDRKIQYIHHNFSSLIPPKCSVLEIGPGKGEFIEYLNTKKITNIDVFDIDAGIVSYIKSKYKIHAGYSAESIQNIENKLQKYDVIFLLQVLEHINKNEHSSLIHLLFQHLKPGGCIIITVPNGSNPFCNNELYGDITHETIFTENSLKQLVLVSNLEDYKIRIFGYKIPPSTPLNILRIGLQWLLFTWYRLLYLINAGFHSSILQPNITLVVEKK